MGFWGFGVLGVGGSCMGMRLCKDSVRGWDKGDKVDNTVSEVATPRDLLGGCSTVGCRTCGGRVSAAGWTTMALAVTVVVNTKSQHGGSTQRSLLFEGAAAGWSWCWRLHGVLATGASAHLT